MGKTRHIYLHNGDMQEKVGGHKAGQLWNNRGGYQRLSEIKGISHISVRIKEQ